VDDEVEFPDGISTDIWPLSAEDALQLIDGGPYWTGSFKAADGERAERLFRGWRAYTRRENGDCYGIWLVPPGGQAEAEAQARGYVLLREQV
jgi:hypothetical protein